MTETTTSPYLPVGGDPTPASFGGALHRLADLIECDEAVPVPDGCSLSWHVDDDDSALALARALADTHGAVWRAADDTRDGGAVLRAVLLPGRYSFSRPIEASIFVRAAEPTHTRTASERLAAEVAGEGDR